MRTRDLLLLLVLHAFWAASYSIYKLLEPNLGVGGIVTLRFGLAGLSLLPFWPLLPGAAPRGWDLVRTILMGLALFTLGQRLQVWGNALGTATHSSLLMGVEPLVTSVAAALFLKETLGRRMLAGFALGMTGVAVISGLGSQRLEWIGPAASLLLLVSFGCEAAYSVMGKPLIARVGILKMLAVSLLAGTAANLMIDGPATTSGAASLSTRQWLLAGVLALVCTTIGYGFWFRVIRRCPVNLAALTVFSQAIFGVATARLWLGEPIRLPQIAGSAIILAGLVLGLSGRQDSGTKKTD
ncbi:MAG: DMT family transporter [Verrucomicrobiota bacterium]